ncbi:MAG: molecular chaperone DnaJ [Egibacteraceae bacterium]
MEDLYTVLGVSKDAGQDEIKRAYRKRARELHPDTGGDEAAFKELTTAYEVLRNPEARANYDRYGDPRGPGGAAGDPFAGFGDLSDLINSFFGGGGGGFGGRAPGQASGSGRDAVVDVRLTLEEAAEGTTRELDVRLQQACQTCDASGVEPGSQIVRCETCNGQGVVQQVTRSVFGQMLSSTTCPRCRGTGQRIERPCPACSGEGRHPVDETITIDVPPGAADGTRLRLSGRGEVGRRGAPSGDLYVRVHVSRHEVFERDGNDLHCLVRLPMVQAALGVELDVPTLDGPERLVVPPGTQPQQVLTMRRKGMPKLSGGGARGDLYVHCEIEVPRHLDGEQTELLRRLAELRGEDKPGSNGDGRGLFDRLRGVFGA